MCIGMANGGKTPKQITPQEVAMTYERAYKECREYFDNDGIGELDAFAFNMALNALGKQIPKKPKKKNPICYAKTKDGQEHFAFDYFCPNCNKQIKLSEHHCKCGQALDWNVTKMTDEQIKKGLECCAQEHKCNECPYLMEHYLVCNYHLHKDTLDLINEQQEAIDGLTDKLEGLLCQATGGKLSYSSYPKETMLSVANDYVNECYYEGQTEAIKEFEVKIHEKLYQAEMHGNFEPVVTREMFDSVVKEMKGLEQ